MSIINLQCLFSSLMPPSTRCHTCSCSTTMSWYPDKQQSQWLNSIEKCNDHTSADTQWYTTAIVCRCHNCISQPPP